MYRTNSIHRFHFSFAILCLVILHCAAVNPVSANPSSTFIVITTNETDDANPGNGACADSAGQCSLRAAVQEANAHSGADTITLPAGTYQYTQDLEITDDLTINGNASPKPIIDGPGRSIVVFAFDIDPTVDVTFNNLVIQNYFIVTSIGMNFVPDGAEVVFSNCDLKNNGDVDTNGPILNTYCENCTVTFSNTDIHGNQGDQGGAFWNKGTLNIWNNSHVYSNTADSAGGAVFNKSGNVSIVHSLLYQNTDNSYNPAGALHQQDGGRTYIESSQVYSNTGGITIANGELIVKDSQIFKNTLGGGIRLLLSTDLILDGVSLEENESEEGGGLSINGNDATVTIKNSSIISNTASGQGGGIYVYGMIFDITILNTTISGNRADGDGGGIYDSAAAMNLANVTISNNVADADDNGDATGGGIYRHPHTDPMNIKNTIIAGNEDLTVSPFEVYNPDCYGTLNSAGYNLIGKRSAAACPVTGDLTGVITGPLNGVNPGLLALVEAANQTWYHPLRFGLVVDAGNPAGCMDYESALLSKDQIGQARPYGSPIVTYTPRCDLGAIESSLKAMHTFLPFLMK